MNPIVGIFYENRSELSIGLEELIKTRTAGPLSFDAGSDIPAFIAEEIDALIDFLKENRVDLIMNWGRKRSRLGVDYRLVLAWGSFLRQFALDRLQNYPMEILSDSIKQTDLYISAYVEGLIEEPRSSPTYQSVESNINHEFTAGRIPLVGPDLNENDPAGLDRENRYRHLIENINEVVLTMDQHGFFTYVTTSVKNLFGYDPSDLLGRSYIDFLFPDDIPFLTRRFKDVLAGNIKASEYRILKKTGEAWWVQSSSRPLYYQGRPVGLQMVMSDINNRKLTEESLQKNEKLLNEIQHLTRIGGWEYHLAVRKMHWTDSVFHILEIPRDFDPNNFYKEIKTFMPEDWKRLKQAFRRAVVYGEPYDLEIQLKTAAGNLLWMRTTAQAEQKDGRTARVFGNIIDITERKNAEAEKAKLEFQLRQAYKMEAIGTLAAGIAHDFNNILTAIMSNTELSLLFMPANHKIRKNLEQILKSGNRARDLVRQILTFSRRTDIEPRPVDMVLLVEEGIKFLRASLPPSVEIKQDINRIQGSVLADSTQLHQVMINLCTNAVQAMPEAGGILTVSLKPVELDPEQTAEFADLKPGAYQRLTVADNGHGIDQETLERIFDPFFTTKETGQGTGLGLALVHGIVKSHKGAITVSSRPNQGTTFHVYLPWHKSLNPENNLAVNNPVGGKEHILLVDDEEPLVEVIREILEHLGYRVSSFVSGREALRAYKENPFGFDLVITDESMPRMSGSQLARELLSLRPDQPIILCTGYSEAISEGLAREIGISAFLMKPITISELGRTIRGLLNK